MGFPIELNWVLALRNYKEHRNGRAAEECLPRKIEEGKSYKFRKCGHRIYPLYKEIDLVETKGEEKLSGPLAKIKISQIILGYNNTLGHYTVIKKLKQY